MNHQPVPPERVFVRRDNGQIHVWRGKTISAASPEELAYIEAKHGKPEWEKPAAATDVAVRNGSKKKGAGK